jgi:hypothetical protein
VPEGRKRGREGTMPATAIPTTRVQGAAEELRRFVLLIQTTINDAAEVARVVGANA